MEGLIPQKYSAHCKQRESVPKERVELTKNYNKAVKQNKTKNKKQQQKKKPITPEQLVIKNVSKQDPKHYLEETMDILMTSNIVQCFTTILHIVSFK